VPIRVGVVGVGWGSIVLVPAFRAVPEFDVVALCSRRQERVQRAGELLGIADASTNWEAFVQRSDLDLIAICTPTDLHYEQTLRTLKAGKHVLCEKPVAIDERQAQQMLATAEDSGLAHAVNFEGRWLPDRLAVGDLVRAGFLGEPYAVHISTLGGLWHPTHALQSEWMYRLDEGGGYLMGLVSHDIDYVCSLFGDPVAVCADVRATIPRRRRSDGTELEVTADDSSSLILRMASGAVVTITTSMVVANRDSRVLDAFGSDGTICIDSVLAGDQGRTRILASRVGADAPSEVAPAARRPRSGAEIPTRRAGSAIRALALMLEDWLPAFAGQPAPGVPTLRDGWLTQRVVDAARRSSAGAGWVDVRP
jgi:predicted dehydrogenase